jgi:hypothetical protein
LIPALEDSLAVTESKIFRSGTKFKTKMNIYYGGEAEQVLSYP